MVRRIGFNDAGKTDAGKTDAGKADAGKADLGNTGRQDIPAAPPESRDIAAEPPGVQRNWTRIIFQSLWVDLWAIAAFKSAESIFNSLTGGGTPSIDALVFLSVALLGGLISVRKLFRMLRGQPVVAWGFLKQSR